MGACFSDKSVTNKITDPKLDIKLDINMVDPYRIESQHFTFTREIDKKGKHYYQMTLKK